LSRRNTAAAVARGAYLIMFDDDTRLGSTDLLERIVLAFDENGTLGIIGVANRVPSMAPWMVRRAMNELPRRSSRLVTEIVDSDMAEHPCLGIRREVFYQVGGEHEQIPRGLDPYLRREVRRLGYRVVVIPHVWIHHLLPSTLRGMLRQYFRNGVAAAYVKRFHPEMVIDQPYDHQLDAAPVGTLPARARRYLGRLAAAVCTLRLVYSTTLVAYAVGYVWGLITLTEASL
jgi:GT2 family glycosyltransferase